MKQAASLPPFAPTLSALARDVKAGKATDSDFGFAALLLRASPFPSRRARREAGANLGSLRLLWAVTS